MLVSSWIVFKNGILGNPNTNFTMTIGASWVNCSETWRYQKDINFLQYAQVCVQANKIKLRFWAIYENIFGVTDCCVSSLTNLEKVSETKEPCSVKLLFQLNDQRKYTHKSSSTLILILIQYFPWYLYSEIKINYLEKFFKSKNDCFKGEGGSDIWELVFQLEIIILLSSFWRFTGPFLWAHNTSVKTTRVICLKIDAKIWNSRFHDFHDNTQVLLSFKFYGRGLIKYICGS